MKNSKILFLLLFLCFAFQGCIRLTGNAGYWRQGTDDEAPQVKQVGFDTGGAG